MTAAASAGPVHAYIGLGGNLGEPAARIARALGALDRLPETRCLARSRLYRNPPMGSGDQPDYVNAVAALETRLPPLGLLDHLQRIEAGEGRVRGVLRWGPRTLDLDLLLYGDECVDHARLTVPHPGLAERRFVLCPLYEIAPELVLPDGRNLAERVAELGCAGLVPLD